MLKKALKISSVILGITIVLIGMLVILVISFKNGKILLPVLTPD